MIDLYLILLCNYTFEKSSEYVSLYTADDTRRYLENTLNLLRERESICQTNLLNTHNHTPRDPGFQ